MNAEPLLIRALATAAMGCAHRGTSEPRDADTAAGQQVHHFEVPTVDRSAAQEVVLTAREGRCFVLGPGA
jgi:hypothetical protein